MKVIANGGASTKNVANNTLDAIYLGLNAPYIDGFKFKLYLTKDKEIITLSDDIVELYTKGLNEIDDYTLKDFLLFNVGSKVQKQQIVTLRQILYIFQNTNKYLILELADQKENNALFTDLVLNMVRSYSNSINIYLESENVEIVEYLKSTDNSYPIGIRVTEESTDNWYIDVDFYDINTTLLDDFNIRDKVKENKLIMIDEVNRMEVFNLIYNEYNDIFDYIYIITSDIANINSNEQIQNRNL